MRHEDKPYRKNVAVVVFNRKGQVLAGERDDMPGMFQFPQGGLDKGEEPLDGARRELYEETGLLLDDEPVYEVDQWLTYDFPLDRQIEKLERYRGQEQKWFFFYWDGDIDGLDLDVHHREFSRLIWTDFATVAAGIVEFKRKVYQQVQGTAERVISDYLVRNRKNGIIK